jgi:hypothetical protein
MKSGFWPANKPACVFSLTGNQGFCYFVPAFINFCFMRKNIQLLSFLLLFHFAGLAQQGIVEGYITDADLKIPVAGATIYTSTEKGDNADVFGRFIIPALDPGRYELLISHIGYRTEIITVNIKATETVRLNVPLKKNTLDLSEVRLNSKRASSLNTIGAIDIKLRPVNTSQDLLRIVPGLFIAQHAGGGKAEQIFLRGYDIDHGTDISVAVDGMPVNMVSHAHGQGYADMHFLIPETVEKANFDKGPYFTTKGNLATAGYVSLETKDFISENQVKLQAGQFNTQRITGLFKLLNKQGDNNRQQFYMASEYFTSDGYFESPQDFHRFNIVGKYTAIIKNNTKLTVLASALDSKWDASGQVPERAVANGSISRFGAIDNSEGGHTSRINISAQLHHRFKNGWQMSDQFYFTKYKFNLYSNFTFFLNDPVNGDEIRQQENRNVWGYTGILSKNYKAGVKKAATEIGYGFRYDDINDIALSHVVRRVFLNDVQRGDIREANSFIYLNQDIELNHQLNLNPGLRYDFFRFGYRNTLNGETGFAKKQKGTISPKLNLSYAASSKLKLYLNSGIGFHSNDSRLITDNMANNSLPKVFGADLGAILKPSKSLVIKTAFWYLYSQQEFVYVGDEGIVEPSGKTRRIGIDASARWQLKRWLYADIDLNYARPRAIGEVKGNDYVPLAPSFTSVGGLSAKMKNGFNGSLRYRYISNRPANEDNSVVAEGYFLLDAVLSYTWKRFEFSLSGENLLNRNWKEAQFNTESRLKNEPSPVSEIHFTPGTPRFIKAGIAFNF